jgi:hypothetical protein
MLAKHLGVPLTGAVRGHLTHDGWAAYDHSALSHDTQLELNQALHRHLPDLQGIK